MRNPGAEAPGPQHREPVLLTALLDWNSIAPLSVGVARPLARYLATGPTRERERAEEMGSG